MRIIKISQFNLIPQNPGAQSDPSVQLQNLQNAQIALDYFNNVRETSSALLANITELEDALGVGDTGLKQQLETTLRTAITKTPAFNLLAQMNFVSSIDNLLDQNQMSNVRNIILKNIQAISSIPPVQK